MIINAYSGIGSRKTPINIMKFMTEIAQFMDSQKYVLRSGGAEGADKAFEKGVTHLWRKSIFLPWEGFNGNDSKNYKVSKGAMDLAEKFHSSWKYLSNTTKLLIARNGYQILGKQLNDPVKLVICYTYNGKDSGGTGQAIRIAQYHNIPIFNLYYEKDIQKILSWIKNGEVTLKEDMGIESWTLM